MANMDKIISNSEYLRRQKISDSMQVSQKIKRGKDHPFWKGDNVDYSSLHEWIRKYKSKAEFCEDCGKKKYLEIANISGEYKRDVDDYKWLCRSCHRKVDFNYETYDGGFKIRPLSFWKGKKMPESVKKKMSDSLKGRSLSEDHKKRISEANMGKHPTEETLQKLRDSHKGKPWSDKRRRLFEQKRGKK